MNTLTRKQREIREREQLILDVGLQLLDEVGFANLTMDKVAERAEYSKGTIYQHFRSKEDLMSAICLRSNQHMQALFQVVSEYQAPSRQKLVALFYAYQFFIETHPVEFENVHHLHTCAATEKMCPTRKDQLDQTEQETMCVASSVIEEGLANGDLPPLVDSMPSDVAFYLWLSSFGLNSLLRAKFPLEDMGVNNPSAVLLKANDVYLDGLGWRPFSTEKTAFEYLAQVEIDLKEKLAQTLQG